MGQEAMFGQAASTGSAPGNGQGARVGSGPFVTDVQALRERARRHMEQGAVTANYGADPRQVIEVLNAALATEMVCVLRYKRHYYMAQGINSEAVKSEFQEHATQEQEHADWLAERIVQLGGEPDLNPEGLAMRSHSQYVEGTTLREMVDSNERVVFLAAVAMAWLTQYAGLPLAAEAALIVCGAAMAGAACTPRPTLRSSSRCAGGRPMACGRRWPRVSCWPPTAASCRPRAPA